MTNDLINLNELGIAQPTEAEEKALSELTQSGDYLPQLRIYGSSSALVKQGKFPQGHFGLYFTADKVVDLDEQVDILIVTYRPRASIMLTDEQPVNYFDPESKNFNDVKTRGKNKEQGFMFGLDYLIWIPSIKHFAVFFMGNPTLRRESPNVKGNVGKAATLKIKFIPSKKWGGWHGCETLACDAPFDIPSNEEIKEVYDSKFANPKDSTVDIADDTDGERAR